MDESLISEKLMEFGLTRQEASMYVCLSRGGELTGYEVAKLTGISRSNVYGGLSGLVDKGAAYLIRGAATRYMAVPIDEFCGGRLRQLQKGRDFLIKNLPAAAASSEGYITVRGAQNIRNRILTMLEQAGRRIYLSAPAGFLTGMAEELEKTVKRGVKLVLITDGKIPVTGAVFYLSDKKENQLRLIIDSVYVLTGDIGGENTDTCLYCGQQDFVNVFKEALRNEIRLIELTGGEERNGKKDVCDEGND